MTALEEKERFRTKPGMTENTRFYVAKSVPQNDCLLNYEILRSLCSLENDCVRGKREIPDQARNDRKYEILRRKRRSSE